MMVPWLALTSTIEPLPLRLRGGACKKENLMPCGEVSALCRAGYLHPREEGDDAEGEFYIGAVVGSLII